MKKFMFLLVALLIPAFFINGCGRTKIVEVVDTVYIEKAQVKVKTALGGTGTSTAGLPKSAVLGKSSAISLNKLILEFTSSTNDTVRDTITTVTPISINSNSASPQTVNKNYELIPLRSWKLVAKTLDLNDSVVHKDSVSTGQLNPADSVAINLSMSSKFQMYEVKFLTLPDSISSSTPGTGKQVLNVNRLKVIIDSGLVTEKIIDSVDVSYFSPGVTHTLSYDYLTPGNHTLKMYVYGPMNFWQETSHLYYISTSINVAAGVDNTTPLTLNWTGPTTGTGKMSVTVGKVGKVTVNGTLPGTVIP